VTGRLLVGIALTFAALVAAPVANSEPGAYSSQDATFYRLLSEDTDDIPRMILANAALLRAQGLLACQRMSDGVDGLDAVYLLMDEGPYSFATANSITSAAQVAYCPQHLSFKLYG
jgi:Protein of unknown function (DUF732)